MILHHIEDIGVGGIQANGDGVIDGSIRVEVLRLGGVGEVEETRIATVNEGRQTYKCSKTMG